MAHYTATATTQDGEVREFLRIIESTLAREQTAAEQTLGRPLADPVLFACNCSIHGLGHALNVEQDLVDLLDR